MNPTLNCYLSFIFPKLEHTHFLLELYSIIFHRICVTWTRHQFTCILSHRNKIIIGAAFSDPSQPFLSYCYLLLSFSFFNYHILIVQRGFTVVFPTCISCALIKFTPFYSFLSPLPPPSANF
jgi:hypothetical protein